ncbi:MAG TPA: 30S ribosomal protein S9 [Candidatus Nealsonbacteria bacterium]|uniref:30S ribosomal protein S9 n=1 Tax=marine sediment metagenome TaxID=412755 RepID=A0A0F9XTY5_9ZZZZ|nr:30S ribosomal protein S9 [Candidatus Nealsonbacteria bacterium]HEB46324.1 30S ribosomal protein S9 [Candidatus Nealsonbacteria bacterium]
MSKTASTTKEKAISKKTLKKKKASKSKKEKTKREKVKVKAKKKVEKTFLEKEISEKYWAGVGRRKTAVARARLFAKGEKKFLVNDKLYQEYFPILDYWQTASSSLRKMNTLDRLRVLVKVRGGGCHAQAEAVRHATARALVKFNPNFRKRLRKAGFLTRDSRMRERKKFGLKRARRAPQWQKR